MLGVVGGVGILPSIQLVATGVVPSPLVGLHRTGKVGVVPETVLLLLLQEGYGKAGSARSYAGIPWWESVICFGPMARYRDETGVLGLTWRDNRLKAGLP
jgi:hypothetical protein